MIIIVIISTLTLLKNYKKKKTIKHEGDGYTNCNWSTWNNPQIISKEIVRLGNKRTNEYHLNYSIIRIGPNTKKKKTKLLEETCC